MSEVSQRRALRNYRSRLSERGMARFEVLGLDTDRSLIRSLAKRMAGNDADATRIRTAVSRTISGEQPKKGGILEALLLSPLAGGDLDFTREITPGRSIDL